MFTVKTPCFTVAETLAGAAGTIKPFIQEVLRKAAINKAGKVYEHGISQGQTAAMLGITQWELASYLGETKSTDPSSLPTRNVKERAKLALSFFS